MTIRPFSESDREIICDIALRTFEGVSIDAAIERSFGPLNDTTWQDRKRRDINADLNADPAGCFVAEVEGRVVAFITTAIDREASVGHIPW